MRCKNVLARLDDHVDGLLPAPEAEAVRDHLDLCRDCRETSLALKAATTSLAGWNDAEPSAECFDKILARLEALPVEAFERAAAASAAAVRPTSVFESARVARFRRVATGGLAAAATVLGALVVSKTEARAVRHPYAVNAVRAASPVAFYSGYDFDDGLLRQRVGSPVRFAPRPDIWDASPR